jgi:hypothetical protein
LAQLSPALEGKIKVIYGYSYLDSPASLRFSLAVTNLTTSTITGFSFIPTFQTGTGDIVQGPKQTINGLDLYAIVNVPLTHQLTYSMTDVPKGCMNATLTITITDVNFTATPPWSLYTGMPSITAIPTIIPTITFPFPATT